MDWALDKTPTTFQITAYDTRQLWINDRCYTQSVLLTPETLIAPWEHAVPWEALMAECTLWQPELILYGTGSRLVWPAPTLWAASQKLKVGCEFMDTGAACRTYRLLAAEGRRLVAVLTL